MKRITIHLTGFIVLLLSFTACEQKDLFLHSTKADIPINVVIHWDSVPSNQLELPRNMTVHWYPVSGGLIASDMTAYGGQEWIERNIYYVMCMDFNGNTNIAFQSNGTRPDFEAYNIRMTGTYNAIVPQLPGGEVTVAEAYPYNFYIDSRSQQIDNKNISKNDTLTVHFYPKNVLREFTFMIYDITGAKNMMKNGGAITGMSGSYYPANGRLAETPSTILFQRIKTIPDAQKSSNWTDDEKALFAAKNPNWASPDTLLGWTRDWVTGKFVTFGPLDREKYRFRLTVESLNNASEHYHGAWGYWHGQWENTVAAQIDSAMGKNGTLEEQYAWRKRNGGYDIVLYNDHRLIVPKGDPNSGSTDGGFTVSVDDWSDIIDVPTVGGNGMRSAASPLKAPVNTSSTISDFVVNGIWKEGIDWERVFNAQEVYKPEYPGTIWDYSPKKYWRSSGDIDFYAYAPANIADMKTGLYNNGNNISPPILEYAMKFKDNREEPPPGTSEPDPVPVVDDKQEDLLVAVQKRPSPQTSPVPMNFRHAFSRVSVKARISSAEYSNGYRIKVTRVDLRNLYTKGKLELKNDNGSTISNGIPMEANENFRYGSSGKVTLWHDLNNLANFRFKLLSTVVVTDDDYTRLVHSDDGIFVIPQQIVAGNNTAIYIEYNVYTYSPTEGEKYLTSATKLVKLNPGFAFEIGKQYVFQIEL